LAVIEEELARLTNSAYKPACQHC